MQKLQQERNFRHERASGLVVAVLFIVVALLSAGRVFAANRLVETSDHLRRLDAEVTDLETQNEVLAAQVREEQSISNASEKAIALGFTKTGSYAYVTSSAAVAFLLK